ncbi:MAG: hypothetical protein NTY09_02270 [bacterium]|nr:hypothetical protein [bacterium]
MRLNILFLSIILLSLISANSGCQGNPVQPGHQPDSTLAIPSGNSDSHICLGLYSIELNRDDSTVEAIPARTADLHLNLTKIFVSTMGLSIAVVPGESVPAQGLFALDFTLKHPLPSHPELTAFDVRGIVICPGSFEINSLKFNDLDETRLENADGYTRWWNPFEFTQAGIFGYTEGLMTNTTAAILTSEVNPYKYFADILGPTDSISAVINEPLNSSEGRGLFSSGASNTRRYLIRFPMSPGPVIVFGYVIDGCWDLPNPNPPGVVPGHFPMTANQPEAYAVSISEEVNTLYYDSESALGGGVLRLKVEIFDWQGQATGDFVSETASVEFYAPSLFSGAVAATYQSQDATCATYYADLTSSISPTHAGKNLLAVRVVSKDGPDYNQGLTYPSPDEPVEAWNILILDIPDPDCAADSNNSMEEAEDIGIVDSATGILCGSADYADYFRLEIPLGYKLDDGMISASSQIPMFGMELTDSEGNVLASEQYGELLQFNLVSQTMESGNYYLKLNTGSTNKAAPYLLETDITLTKITPDNPIDITPKWLDLQADWISVRDNLAYLASDTGIWIYDIADTSYPQWNWRSLDHCTLPPAFSFPDIYFIDSSSGTVKINYYDLSTMAVDPFTPTFYEDVIPAAQAVAVAMDPDYLYVALDTDTVQIYDISTDPANPSLVNSFPIIGGLLKMDILGPDSAYTTLVVMSSAILRFYNVEDPMNVADKGSNLLTDGGYIDFSISDTTLFSIDSFIGNHYFRGYHLDGVTYELEYDGNVALPYLPYHVTGIGSKAYIGAQAEGIMIVDWQTPTAPVYESTMATEFATDYVLTASTNLLAASPTAGFTIYDLTDSSNPAKLSRPICLNNPIGGAVVGDYVYFIESKDDYNAVMTVQITNPANARLRDEDLFNEPPGYIAGNNSIAAVATESTNGIYILNLTDPQNPVPELIANLSNLPIGMTMNDTHLFVTTEGQRLEVFDISNYPTVTQEPGANTSVNVSNPVLNGDVLYGNGNTSVLVFDISNPDSPTEEAPYGSLPDIASSQEVRDGYLYVCTSGTLAILDISSPLAPSPTSELAMPYSPDMRFVAIDEIYAYVGDQDHHPVIVDLGNIDSPVIFGETFQPQLSVKSEGYFIHGRNLYEFQEGYGVRIFDLYLD